LQQVVKSGTGTEALQLNRPAAAKTGTAALRPDTTTSAWFVGFTPQLCAAVDFYKGTGKADLDGVGGLSTFFGGEYPARIWTAFMTAAMEGKKVEDFPQRADVGKTLNPKPTKKPTPTPTTTSPTPTPTSPTPTGSPTVTPTTPTPTGTITITPLVPSDEPSFRNGGP
jgi:membrane peptidoglycan carboxypeptidase